MEDSKELSVQSAAYFMLSAVLLVTTFACVIGSLFAMAFRVELGL